MRAEKLKVISVLDPALETERMTFAQIRDYNQTRDFAKVAPYLKPGEFATVYHVRECPQTLWPWIMSAGEDHEERYARAFRACVERVENLFQRDGARLETWAPGVSNGTPKAMADEEAARCPNSDRAEVGRVAFEHSFLPRRIEGCFRLHALSAVQLGQRMCRLAESSQPGAEATNSGEPSGSSGPSPDTTGNASTTPADA